VKKVIRQPRPISPYSHKRTYGSTFFYYISEFVLMLQQNAEHSLCCYCILCVVHHVCLLGSPCASLADWHSLHPTGSIDHNALGSDHPCITSMARTSYMGTSSWGCGVRFWMVNPVVLPLAGQPKPIWSALRRHSAVICQPSSLIEWADLKLLPVILLYVCSLTGVDERQHEDIA
jgi:hypothetical protein